MSQKCGGLPDYLAPRLSIIFVGINPGLRSSKVGHHFAGHSNRFWKLMFESGLVPERMTCHDDRRLLDYGYGLTNLIAKPTASIQELTRQDFLEGRTVLREKILTYRPAIVAILGISVARIMVSLGEVNTREKGISKNSTHTGLQPKTLGGCRVFVLPNPSGRNAHYSYAKMKQLFVELKVLSLQLQKSSETKCSGGSQN